MSYENAPATRMVATRCCVCRKELVDAKSVEYGIGPECRKRHGFNESEAPADWAVVEQSLLKIRTVAVDTAIKAIEAKDARKLANVLTHAAAVTDDLDDVATLAQTVYAVGFRKLGGIIAKRRLRAPAVIEITADAFRLGIKTPYNAAFRDRLRGIDGRGWDKASKTWSVPTSARAAVWVALKETFSGRLLVSAKGLALIG